MHKLEELLKMPCWGKQEYNWKRLTDGNILFKALREAVRSSWIGEASNWVGEWKSFIESFNVMEE